MSEHLSPQEKADTIGTVALACFSFISDAACVYDNYSPNKTFFPGLMTLTVILNAAAVINIARNTYESFHSNRYSGQQIIDRNELSNTLQQEKNMLIQDGSL